MTNLSKEQEDWVDKLLAIPLPPGTETLILSYNDKPDDDELARRLDILMDFAERTNLKILVLDGTNLTIGADVNLAAFGLQRIPK